MKKGAIELSVNFLVILIISLVVFSFGVIFVYNLYEGSDSIKKITLEDIDAQIADLKCSNFEKICLDKDSIFLKPKELEIVSMKVLNVGNANDDFFMTANVTKYVDRENVEQPLSSGAIQILPSERQESIPENKNKVIGFGFQLGNAQKGSYVVDLKVYQGTIADSNNQYDKTHKVYIQVK